ncbi:MAG: extracellular solute-binding protein, partial [Verrucomicrobia bacterium]|nr:extracellular solute-binding protein [Verrucomicrobiota bacterium]
RLANIFFPGGIGSGGRHHPLNPPLTPLLVLLGLPWILTACVPQRESVREITFSLWGATEQLKAEEAIVAEFEKQHPGIRVRLMPMGARYLEKLQAMFVGQAAPDVIMIEISMYDNWASRGVLADLTEDLRKITRDHPLLPVPQRAFERNGRFFGIPINCHGHVAYVNLDAFRATGVPLPDETWTWEKLLAQSPLLSRRHGNSLALTDYALLIPQFPIFLTAEGATLFDSDSLPTRVTADQPAVHRAFDLVRRLQASGCAVPPEVQSDQGDFQLFRDGRLAVYFAGRWISPEYAKIFRNDGGGSGAAALLRSGHGSGRRYSPGTGRAGAGSAGNSR